MLKREILLQSKLKKLSVIILLMISSISFYGSNQVKAYSWESKVSVGFLPNPNLENGEDQEHTSINKPNYYGKKLPVTGEASDWKFYSIVGGIILIIILFLKKKFYARKS